MNEARLLARQAGLITRSQALGIGMARTTITRRLTTKHWHSVYPGVYRHVAATVDDLLMVHAAVLWLGPEAVVSGSWAAWLHQLRSEPTGPVSMTVPRSASQRRHLHLLLRRRDLDPGDVVSVRGLRVTSRPLTALENTVLCDGRDVFDRALQRFVSVPQLDDSLSRLRGATGAVAARAALATARDGTVSPPERKLAAALRRAGLTQLRAGVRVKVGDRLCWLDFGAVALRLAVEVDGVRVHSDPTVFAADRERQNALILAGWTVLRFTPQQIDGDLPGVLAQISRAIETLGG